MEQTDLQADVRTAAEPHGSATEDQPSGTHLLELWSDREEARAIPELLRPDEGLVCVGSGTVLRSGRLAQSRWLVVLTDRRLLCIKGRAAATRRVIEMPTSAIRSVERKGLIRSTLTFDTGYGNLRISDMKKPIAIELVDGLNALMRAHRGDTANTAIRRAQLPGNGEPDVLRLAEAVANLQADVVQLRARVEAVERMSRESR
jgi:hypothetical protein